MRHSPTASTRHARIRRWAPILALGLVVASGAGCGTDDGAENGSSPSPTPHGDAAASDLTPAVGAEMCATWAASFGDAEDHTAIGRLIELVEEHAPDHLAGDVERFRTQMETTTDGSGVTAVEPDELEAEIAASHRVMAWLSVICNEGGPPVAPPLDALPAGIEVCLGSSLPIGPADHMDPGTMVIYGRADLDDPYTGPLLTLVHGPGSQAGDGDPTPITVRGTEGVAAPIGVFQAVALAELGTVVAWQEEGLGFGLYGRGWEASRAEELVALAERMTPVPAASGEGGEAAGWEIPADALPEGFVPLHRGSAAAGSLVQFGSYSVWYGSGEGDNTTTLTGIVGPAGEEMAWRAFALDSEVIDVDGRQVAFTRAAWTDDGPAVASWRIDDERYVVIASMFPGGVTPEDVLELVEASRPLSDEEWIAVAETVGCQDL